MSDSEFNTIMRPLWGWLALMIAGVLAVMSVALQLGFIAAVPGTGVSMGCLGLIGVGSLGCWVHFRFLAEEDDAAEKETDR